jgi:hypothetical protein
MVGEEDNGSNLDGLDVDDNIEIKAAKVDIGNNYAIVSNELENGNAFFVFLCNKPLHTCMENFNNGKGNMWYKGYMILGGIWYKCVAGPSTQNPFYMLLKDVYPTVTYFHLDIKSKLTMLRNAKGKVTIDSICLHTLGKTYLVLLNINKHIVPIDVLYSKFNAKKLVD